MWFKFLTISAFSSIVAGMGIGGGSIFILLSTIFSLFSQRQAQAYNLFMFIAVGISASILNFKNKTIDKKMFFKLIIPTCLGSVTGITLMKILNEDVLKKFFYIFMILLGSYEIFSSLKSIKSTKNNNGERR